MTGSDCDECYGVLAVGRLSRVRGRFAGRVHAWRHAVRLWWRRGSCKYSGVLRRRFRVPVLRRSAGVPHVGVSYGQRGACRLGRDHGHRRRCNACGSTAGNAYRRYRRLFSAEIRFRFHRASLCASRVSWKWARRYRVRLHPRSCSGSVNGFHGCRSIFPRSAIRW